MRPSSRPSTGRPSWWKPMLARYAGRPRGASVVSRKLGELPGRSLPKGSRVYIEGRLQTRSWEGQDGEKRKTTEVNAPEGQFLEPRSQSQGAPAAAASPREPVEVAPAAPAADEAARDVDPEDIPF